MTRALERDKESTNDSLRNLAIATEDLITGFRSVANFVEAAYRNESELYINWIDIREHINYVMDALADVCEFDVTFEGRAIEFAEEQGYTLR